MTTSLPETGDLFTTHQCAVRHKGQAVNPPQLRIDRAAGHRRISAIRVIGRTRRGMCEVPVSGQVRRRPTTNGVRYMHDGGGFSGGHGGGGFGGHHGGGSGLQHHHHTGNHHHHNGNAQDAGSGALFATASGSRRHPGRRSASRSGVATVMVAIFLVVAFVLVATAIQTHH